MDYADKLNAFTLFLIILAIIGVSYMAFHILNPMPPITSGMVRDDHCLTASKNGIVDTPEPWCATQNAEIDARATAIAKKKIPAWWPFGH